MQEATLLLVKVENSLAVAFHYVLVVVYRVYKAFCWITQCDLGAFGTHTHTDTECTVYRVPMYRRYIHLAGAHENFYLHIEHTPRCH